ncbi:hypothetical protein GCM10025875_29440 [Litorihabitans aurantiacus]|uniref:alpha-L-fucosidase n=1 Tax=Litorihabitans aurantiacus TaxID=1930061 RepID=A0AA38CWB9_9MICO|nr:hypothetical protein GCM10025875_29440 [Litorihabitans aurantiacus]
MTAALITSALPLSLTTALAAAPPAAADTELPDYDASPASLNSHPLPEWFDDAKFGIFIHWGAYSVPAWAAGEDDHGGENYAEWYGKYMTNPESAFYRYHRDTYGEDYDYDQFLEDWDPAQFDPDAWVDTIADAGARYVVLTSKHHDGIALWDSPTGRDTVDRGPGRDLAGELMGAVREDGRLKAGFYYSLLEWWHAGAPNAEQRTNPYTGEQLPYTGIDLPAGSDYVADYMHPQIEDLIDSYDPDILWCDGEWDVDAATWDMGGVVADFYNQAKNRDVPKEVVVTDRCKIDQGRDDPEELDFQTPEYEVRSEIETSKWESSRGIGRSYGYNQRETDADYQTADEIVDSLVDIVSKNGNLLLNIGPRADGTIPEIQQERLAQVGEWLEVNGDAIYGTSYWQRAEEPASATDVRYTMGDDTLYATALDWPEDELTLGGDLPFTAATTVSLLGSDAQVPWSRAADGAIVLDTSGLEPSNDIAHSFAISTPGTDPLLRAELSESVEATAGTTASTTLRLANPSGDAVDDLELNLAAPPGWRIEQPRVEVPRIDRRSFVEVPISLTPLVGAGDGQLRVQVSGGTAQELVFPVSTTKLNLAEGRPARQSTTYTEPGSDNGAARAVDGSRTSGLASTADEDQGVAWWEVDLEDVTDLGEVRLFNREDCCTERLADLTVSVSSEPFPARPLTADELAADGVVTVPFEGRVDAAPSGSVVELPDGAQGKHVRVQLGAAGVPLNLMEVEVAPGLPSSAPFVDVGPDALFGQDIAWLVETGIATGWPLPDGTAEFRPLEPVARDAMAAFLFRLIGDDAYTAPTESPFADVAPGDQFYREITWLSAQGIATGWPGGAGEKPHFRPLDPIGRDAMAAFLHRAAGRPAVTPPAASPFTDVAPGVAYYDEIVWLTQNGVATGWVGNDGTSVFQPLAPIARDATAAFLRRFDGVVQGATATS